MPRASLRLVADASSLVAEVLRRRGRGLLLAQGLELAIAHETMSETRHELRRRIALMSGHRQLRPEQHEILLRDAEALIAARVSPTAPSSYWPYITIARRRVPRDPDDAPTVALALALECGIWTADQDFFGCGVPVWTTDTLLLELEAQQSL